MEHSLCGGVRDRAVSVLALHNSLCACSDACVDRLSLEPEGSLLFMFRKRARVARRQASADEFLRHGDGRTTIGAIETRARQTSCDVCDRGNAAPAGSPRRADRTTWCSACTHGRPESETASHRRVPLFHLSSHAFRRLATYLSSRAVHCLLRWTGLEQRVSHDRADVHALHVYACARTARPVRARSRACKRACRRVFMCVFVCGMRMLTGGCAWAEGRG